MQKIISNYLLTGVLITIVFVGISCSQKQEDSIFLLEGNIIGPDTDFLLGGYDPMTVETNLVIPLAEYLAKNNNIKSIKYQIHSMYFRMFLRTINSADMYSQLERLINELPSASDPREYLQKSVEKQTDQNIYIASGNYSGFRKDDIHILRKPLLLPLSGMTEEKLTKLTPEIVCNQLLIKCDRMRLDRFNIKLDDIRDIISTHYFALTTNDSILLTQLNDIKELENMLLYNSEGISVRLADVAQFENSFSGINRPWKSMAEFR
jgi:hypothetical protein